MMPAPPNPRGFLPRLIVRDVDAAIAFYRNALGAELVERFAEPDGRVGFAKLTLGGFPLSLSEEVPEWGWISPVSLGGSPVLIQLELEDCDLVAEKMVAEKAEIVIPIKDRPYGKREGRLRDPFGHLWILSQEVAR
jgi:PhnB protein